MNRINNLLKYFLVVLLLFSITFESVLAEKITIGSDCYFLDTLDLVKCDSILSTDIVDSRNYYTLEEVSGLLGYVGFELTENYYNKTEIDNIVEEIMEKDYGNINLNYKGHKDQLNVWGKAANKATTLRVLLSTPDGVIVYDEVANTKDLLDIKSYNISIDLSKFDYIDYNVVVKFFNEDGNLMKGFDVGDIFSNFGNYGINDIIISTRVETYYNPNVMVPVTYTVYVDEVISDAKIIIRALGDSNLEFEQELRTQTLFANKINEFTNEVLFNELGYYNFEIVIIDDNKDEELWISEQFGVNVVNLPDEMPVSDAYLTSPKENWDVLNEEAMYAGSVNPFPEEDKIYWQSWNVENSIELNLTLFEGTSIQYCRWEIFNPMYNSVDGRLRITSPEDGVNICAGKIYNFDVFPVEGLYYLYGKALFEAGVYLEDEMVVGVDNTNPVISGISPELGVYSGRVFVSVNATDSLSGVKEVWVTMVKKDNAENIFTLEAFYDSESESYVAVFDTVELGMPDSNYNITAIVYDVAGNSAELTVDPVIDNTAPVIRVLENNFTAYSYEGNSFYLKFEVNENLAGINESSVKLIFEENNHICDIKKNEGDLYSAIFETVNCSFPISGKKADENLMVVLEAYDIARPANRGSNKISVTLYDVFSNETMCEYEENEKGEFSDGNFFISNGEIVREECNKCVVISNISLNDNGGESLTLSNNCSFDVTSQIVVELVKGKNVTLELVVKADSNRYIYTTNEYLVSPEFAMITDLVYDVNKDSILINLNGTDGIQNIFVYLEAKGKPKNAFFDKDVLSEWTYEKTTGFFESVVECTNTHELELSWLTVSNDEVDDKVDDEENNDENGGNNGGSGGGSGGSSGSYSSLKNICVENWSCGKYGECFTSGSMVRSCIDINKCGTDNKKPVLFKSCEYVRNLSNDDTVKSLNICGDGICQIPYENEINCSIDCKTLTINTSEENSKSENDLSGVVGAVVGGGNFNFKSVISGLLALFAIIGILFMVSFRKARM